MGTRTVRLDAEAEAALDEIRSTTGMSISEALKRGLLALRRAAEVERRSPWDVYEKLDLGPGGYSTTPSTEAKRAMRKIVGRKHRR